MIKAIRSNKLYIKLKFLIVMRPLREIITPAKASICQLLLGGVLKTSTEEPSPSEGLGFEFRGRASLAGF